MRKDDEDEDAVYVVSADDMMTIPLTILSDCIYFIAYSTIFNFYKIIIK
jgi:hypothetical protein